MNYIFQVEEFHYSEEQILTGNLPKEEEFDREFGQISISTLCNANLYFRKDPTQNTLISAPTLSTQMLLPRFQHVKHMSFEELNIETKRFFYTVETEGETKLTQTPLQDLLTSWLALPSDIMKLAQSRGGESGLRVGK
eukprot:Selendium_serpulae@DN11177_c0_g1_i1.p1